MDTDVSFLMGGIAVQAVPRLAERLGIELDLPPERMLYGLGLGDLVGSIGRYEEILRSMMTKHDISWREVFEASDVGRERVVLVEKIGPKQEDIILDVGFGKVFTTAALAFDSAKFCARGWDSGPTSRLRWTRWGCRIRHQE